MTYETLNSISAVTGIACLVMAALTVGLFFLLKIPEAFSFITGRTQRLGIETIQRTGTANADTGGAKSRKLSKTGKKEPKQKKPTQKSAKQEMKKAVTDVLPGNGNTTGVLTGDGSQTTVLNGAEGGNAQVVTQPLHQNLVFTQQPFVVEFDITYVTSNVVIGEER